MIRGRYEEPLVLALEQFFKKKKYSTHLHAQLNISWSNIISDVDLLAIKKDEIIAVEVKSKRDVFTNAFEQLDKVIPFVDKAFIATDNEITANKFRNMKNPFGILYIDLVYDKIVIKKNAKTRRHKYSQSELCTLRKCCLQELARECDIASYQSKPYLALDLMEKSNSSKLRLKIRDMVVYWRCNHLHHGLEYNIK